MNINRETRARYDTLPYGSYAYTHSAPEQIAAVAALFGVSRPDVAGARVLELGAASGGNLIPFALRNPHATTVGVDISGVQVARGNDLIGRLGIDNVILREADLLELDPQSLGQFDYIIAHGVYSWVPPEVQRKVLEICGCCLAPEGIAYVSYNTYPGWKTKEIIRDAMLLHGGSRPSAAEQVAYGRAMLEFLNKAARKGGVTDLALKESLGQVRHAPADYIAHDFLEPCNLPCYFHQFTQAAAEYGLAYLAEAQPSMMLPSNYGEALAAQLYGALGDDQLRVEQYLDFAIDRAFRQTLLIRTERAGQLHWKVDMNSLHKMHFAASLSCSEGAIRLDGTVQEFVTPVGATIAAGLSGVKQAMELLTQTWPGTVPRDELLRHALQTQSNAGSAAADVLEQAIDELLASLVIRGMARMRLEPVEAVPSATLPMIDPVVRRMLGALAPGESHVADLWHDSIEVSEAERLLLPLMDGSMDRTGLISRAGEMMADGRLQSTGPLGSLQTATGMVDATLDRLKTVALLRR